MAIQKFLVDLAIISKLGEYPGSDNGLSTAQFKAKFDEAALRIQEYLNDILIPELDKIVDVNALIADILDETLTKSDKAAPAATVGKALRTMERNHASFFSQTVKSGDYVLEADQNFKVELLTVNKVRVYGGKYVAQGNLVEVNLGGYVDLDMESGSVGLYRHDLICARYERNADGVETNSIVLVKGTAVQLSPADPAVNTGDINGEGAVIHETPFARIVWNNANPVAERILEAQAPAGDKDVSTKEASATLPVSGWVSSAVSGFVQTITVTGLTDGKKAIVYPVQPETLAEKLALAEELAKVRACSRSGNQLTFECWEEQPTVDISVMVEVYV